MNGYILQYMYDLAEAAITLLPPHRQASAASAWICKYH